MLTLVGIAILAFVVTNLDDLVILTAFCGHEQYRLREVVLGQYLGFGALVGISIVGGVGVAALAAAYVRWLGLFPLAIGLLWYVRMRREDASTGSEELPLGETPQSRAGLVAGVSIADGGDNVVVYIPLFAALGVSEMSVVIAVFLVAAGWWVLFARWLSTRPGLASLLENYANAVIPAVLVGIGLVILADVL